MGGIGGVRGPLGWWCGEGPGGSPGGVRGGLGPRLFPLFQGLPPPILSSLELMGLSRKCDSECRWWEGASKSSGLTGLPPSKGWSDRGTCWSRSWPPLRLLLSFLFLFSFLFFLDFFFLPFLDRKRSMSSKGGSNGMGETSSVSRGSWGVWGEGWAGLSTASVSGSGGGGLWAGSRSPPENQESC